VLICQSLLIAITGDGAQVANATPIAIPTRTRTARTASTPKAASGAVPANDACVVEQYEWWSMSAPPTLLGWRESSAPGGREKLACLKLGSASGLRYEAAAQLCRRLCVHDWKCCFDHRGCSGGATGDQAPPLR